MDQIRTLIFDCDGVLLDSEILVCTFVSEELSRLGYPITATEVMERYCGRPEREILADVAAHWGQPVPEEYRRNMKRRVGEAFTSALRTTPGVLETIPDLRMPICVASSSGYDKLRVGLGFVGLLPYFDPHIVSAQFVAHGKPAPDVFLYAAGLMRTPVQHCLVLEDSFPGVRAARAAGMRVLGFAGGSHCGAGHAERLREAGAEHVISDMRELRESLPGAFTEAAQVAVAL